LRPRTDARRMHLGNVCKCINCGDKYTPDARNRHHQKYCGKPECRAVSKKQSQGRWLAHKKNRDHFRNGESTQRVREWRLRHPGYRKSRAVKPGEVQQDLLNLQNDAARDEAKVAAKISEEVQQDLLDDQNPLIVGFISHMANTVQREVIVEMMDRFITKGRAVLGKTSGGPIYDKTNPERGKAAENSVAV
jgi:hypothetical protein